MDGRGWAEKLFGGKKELKKEIRNKKEQVQG